MSSTSSLRLPNFLILGAARAGTSWLGKAVDLHPEIYCVDPELHFFSVDSYYERGLEHYAQHFEPAGDAKAVGEKSPSYWTYFHADDSLAAAPQRIARDLPDAKLLVSLRNPVDRFISAFFLHRWNRRFPAGTTLEDVVLGGVSIGEGWDMISPGKYARQLAGHFELFGRERLRIYIFEEDIRQHPRRTLRDIFGFLGVDPDAVTQVSEGARNRAVRSAFALDAHCRLPQLGPVWQVYDRLLGTPMAASKEVRHRLADIYADDVRRLEELLGRDLTVWLGA